MQINLVGVNGGAEWLGGKPEKEICGGKTGQSRVTQGGFTQTSWRGLFN